MCHCNTDLSFCKFCILFYQNDVIYLSVYIQLLTKVSTLPHDEPLDFMLNVIHGIGYSSSVTAWIIDLKLVS